MAISKIVQNSLSDTISLGPKITSIQVANSTYVVKDDTNINIGGGYIVITGSGFQSNCSVIVDSNLACSVAFVSATQVRAELPAKSAGTYNIYLLNGDGGTAIRVNALQYSNTPTWVTTSPLTSQVEDSNVSIQLEANGANTYSLQTGSTLPTGLTLSANGLISGLVNTNVSVETTFNFTVEAIDTELQETPKAFAVTITVGEADFYRTTLLLNGDGTNGANNNVFRDSSNNNFAITRYGNASQGSVSPFSPAGWSNYLDGSSAVYISSNSNFNFGTGLFTVEGWFNFSSLSAPNTVQVLFNNGSSGSTEFALYYNPGSTRFELDIDEGTRGTWTYTPTAGIWYHIALVKSSSNAYDLYVNGTTLGQRTHTYTQAEAAFNVGSITWAANYGFRGYLSNFRVLKGTALYTSNTSIANTELTAIANTVLLTAQSNRFKDNSNNNFSLLQYGAPEVTNFTPFKRTTQYSTTLHGGSTYLDGTGDYLSAPASTQYNFDKNNFTIESWFYIDPKKTISGGGMIFDYNYEQLQLYYVNNPTYLYCDIRGWGTNINLTSTSVMKTGQWYHVAIVRDGTSSFKMYLNGVLEATTSTDAGSVNLNTYPLYWGCRVNPSGGAVDYLHYGYLAGSRVSSTAVYTGAFTPSLPTVISGTQLLLNHTNAGIYDWTTRNVIETIGDAKVNTAITKYGTGSLEFDGTGDILDVAHSPLWINFLTGDFTIEGWFYARTLTSYNGMVTHWRTNGTTGWTLETVGSGIFFYIWNTATSGYAYAGGGTFTTNQWNHVACVKNGANITIYLNGTATGDTLSMTGKTTSESTDPIVIGGMWSGTGPSGGLDTTADWDGFIDDLRISRFARYTANFTPPTSALQIS
jgi:hypothetical protein